MTNLPKGSKGFAHILLLVILVVGLVVVVDLVKNQTIFKSKASEGRAVNIPGAPSNLRFNCVNGNLGSFTWNVTPGINSYILSINRIDGNPPDWFPASDGAGTGDRLLKRDTGLGATYASFIEPIDKDKNYSWGVKVNSKDAVYIDGGEFSCGHPTAYMWGSDFDHREFTVNISTPFTFNVSAQTKDAEGWPSLTKAQVYVGKKSDIDSNDDSKKNNWKLVEPEKALSVDHIDYNGSWTTPSEAEDYYMVVNIYDSLNRRCSGNPNLPAGWSKCGTKDSILVHVTNKQSTTPVSSQMSPTAEVNILTQGTIKFFTPVKFGASAKGERLTKLEIYVAPADSDLSQGSSWKQIGSQNCYYNSNCDITEAYFTPPTQWCSGREGCIPGTEGHANYSPRYIVVVNAHDQNGSWCSGNPTVSDGTITAEGLSSCGSRDHWNFQAFP